MLSRRSVIGAASVLAARRVIGANDRIRVGVIGVGNRSNLLIDQLPDIAEVVAVADCYPKRAYDAAAKREAKWRIYDDHRRLLEQKDVDAVIVGTGDHQRAWCCVHACQAGKDVYAEKPLTLWVRPVMIARTASPARTELGPLAQPDPRCAGPG